MLKGTIEIPKPRYKRMGECKRCGACCLVEDPPCPHLKWDGKIANCKILNSLERPKRCEWFPQVPPIPFESCGYYFIDTWEDSKIVKNTV